ncbi:MAG: response regulator [Herbinix sp.]|jgi:two-component system response regulator YesN|nr:response regulator [Herbinix sp.]
MYKVMIVDDEVLVRIGLKTTIDWEAYGFTIVSEASNGEQGYENYLKYKPDVIITDIKMPKQDGLWLVEKIRKENVEARILVLTCYDEFSYARRALKIGADDYILKSEVEDEELVKIMIAMKEKIDLQNKAKAIKDNSPFDLEELKRSIVSSLIKREFQVEERLLKSLKDLNFPTTETSFTFMSISVNHNKGIQMDMQQVSNAVMNILFEQLNYHEIAYIDGQLANRYLFFISSPNLKPSDIKNIFTFASNGAKQYFDISLNCVYSKIFNQVELAGNVYKEYSEKVQVLFYEMKHNNLFMQMDEIKFTEPNVFDLKKANNKNFIEAIGQENLEKVRQLNEEIGQYFERGNVSPAIVKIFYSNLIGDLFSSYGLFLSKRELFETHETYHYQIENSDHLVNIDKLLIDFATSLIDEIQNMRYTNSRFMINQALNFIEYHYSEDISLDDVAKELNLSKHYLCSAFKKETGENMSLYINNLRIEKAKQLLLESDFKIKEIFERVGYSNQQYFSKVFKKITGMTVIEYKESMVKK